MSTEPRSAQTLHPAASTGLPSAQPADAASHPARDPCHLLVLRASVAVKLNAGTLFFSKGEVLDGMIISHPVNAFRKVIIRTEQGVFNVNEEDVAEIRPRG
jgi:hypothetical protein